MARESDQVECRHICIDTLQTYVHDVLLLPALLIISSRHNVGGEVIRTLFSSAHKKYLYREHSKETNTCQCCGVHSF